MNISLITIPYDSGHHKQRLGLGPDHLLPHMEKHLKRRGHTVRHVEILDTSLFRTEITTSFELGRMTALCVKASKENGAFPIIISGNCNTAAMGATCGLGQIPGVIWFDCHGDFNTPETTIGGFLDGMAISIITGQCWTQLSAAVPGYEPIPEEKIILAGVRDLDPLESERIRHSRISVLSAEQINSGSDMPWPEIDGAIYLHIDLDVIDPLVVRVNDYSSPGGLTPAVLLKTIKEIKQKYSLSAVSFTAYDPELDAQEKVPGIVNLLLDEIVDEAG